MKAKSKIKSIVSFLFILIFSTTAFAQSKSLTGEWDWLSFTENGVNIPLSIEFSIEKKPSPQLWLSKNSFTIQPACNHVGGKYTITKSGRLKFSQIRVTVMACRKDAHEIDGRFTAVLSKAVKYKIMGKILTLQDASGRNVLTFSRPSSRTKIPQ